MRFINLASSSSGNCHYIELDRKDLPPVKLMLEVGLSYSDILSKCITNQIDLNSIDAFLVTHGHGDHSRAVMDLIKRHKKVFANNELTLGNQRTTLESAKTSFIAVDTKVIPFDVEHDAPHSLGFVITTGLETILFVNDCKFFTADLSKIKFDYVFMESNYDGVTIHYAYQNARDTNNNA
ncbi:MAG: MBL fold metallo-hydrolase, partial [Longicatena sp.]